MAKKDTLFDKIVKEVKKKNDFAFVVGEENPYEVSSWIDTGCYVLNAILSDGDIYKGFPEGKRMFLFGGEATAKSLLTMLLIKAFVKTKKNPRIVIFETEGSSTVDMIRSAGIYDENIIIVPVTTVEDCRSQMLNIIETINDAKYGYISSKSETTGKITKKKIKDFKTLGDDEQENFIFILDSLGMLGTEKETEDIQNGKNVRDMTRAQLLKGFARATSLKLSLSGIPLIVVNHEYSTMDMYNPKEMSGGSAGKYMGDILLQISKGKQKEGTEQIGIVLNMKTYKSRYMQENKTVKVVISFKKGFNKYSSLYDMANELNVFEKEGYSWILADGEKVTMKDIRENPSKYFAGKNLDMIRDAIKANFGFGECAFIDESDQIESEDSNEYIIIDNSESEELLLEEKD